MRSELRCQWREGAREGRPTFAQGEHGARESDLRHPCRLLHCTGRPARDDIPRAKADTVTGRSSRGRLAALLVSPRAWRPKPARNMTRTPAPRRWRGGQHRGAVRPVVPTLQLAMSPAAINWRFGGDE